MDTFGQRFIPYVYRSAVTTTASGFTAVVAWTAVGSSTVTGVVMALYSVFLGALAVVDVIDASAFDRAKRGGGIVVGGVGTVSSVFSVSTNVFYLSLVFLLGGVADALLARLESTRE